MTDVLGYRRFVAQGGDRGGFVASRLGYQFAERMIGIHLNFLAVRRDPKMLENPTEEERRYLDQLTHFLSEETGYQWIQGTKPTTLAFADGFARRPGGLDRGEVPELDRLQRGRRVGGRQGRGGRPTSCSTGLSGAIGSSFWPAVPGCAGAWPIPEGAMITVPTGCVGAPKETLQAAPLRWRSARYTQIRRWTRAEQDGHSPHWNSRRCWTTCEGSLTLR